ncbi:hypothetical protein C7S18_09535 [Ahniella affigens]|uniref:Uncharacterized protein n=1 Tax=Ahniella affigens TaxID=2021234 RepID=A0A2P1PRG7_9GAMM|nr:hypothetical protein C7S18_09535 [Ahniella affigens]
MRVLLQQSGQRTLRPHGFDRPARLKTLSWHGIPEIYGRPVLACAMQAFGLSDDRRAGNW